MALIVGAIALPPTPILTDGRDVWLRGLLAVIAATGTVVAVASRSGATGRAVSALAVAAPGLVLTAEMAFIVLARQHREMISTGPLGLRLTGPALPVWLWSVAVAAAIGVLLTAIVLVPLRRRLLGVWPQHPYPLALAAVVASGLLIRVATWLAIAPERTDGGDPLFYHVTANAVAAGRGFPEPLNWLDSGTQLASALHGPLYPLVLSIGSRLGGITYVDHKFVSILVGTATVLLTALVAERLGGRTGRLGRRCAGGDVPEPLVDRQPPVPRGPVRHADDGLHPDRLPVARSAGVVAGGPPRCADRPRRAHPRGGLAARPVAGRAVDAADTVH